jgi:flagellar biosynthetic protein FlhB
MMQGLQISLEAAASDSAMSRMRDTCIAALIPSLPGLAMIVFAAMGVGLVCGFLQVGLVLSPEAMIPTLTKIDPFQGAKRLFSIRSSIEGAKAVAKSLLFGWLVWSSISASWPILANLANTHPYGALQAVGSMLQSIVARVAVAWIVLAAIDYFVQRKQVDKSLRMTKQEVRQEMKEAETSPEFKAARAQKIRRLLRGRMMEAVKTADVVVTNPTHFAVALKYRPGQDHAPTVVAKGQDFLAARIREVAAEARVPLVPNPPLARALYKQCEIGDFVPRELFQAVAEVLAFVYKTVKAVRQL